MVHLKLSGLSNPPHSGHFPCARASASSWVLLGILASSRAHGCKQPSPKLAIKLAPLTTRFVADAQFRSATDPAIATDEFSRVLGVVDDCSLFETQEPPELFILTADSSLLHEG